MTAETGSGFSAADDGRFRPTELGISGQSGRGFSAKLILPGARKDARKQARRPERRGGSGTAGLGKRAGNGRADRGGSQSISKES